jgi:hypothetical protein
MKVGTGIQAILRFCLRNLNGCNVCIIDGIYEVRRLDGLRWQHIHPNFHEDWYRRSSNINVLP